MPFKSGAITEFRGVQDELTDADLAPLAQGALALILLRKSMDVHEDTDGEGNLPEHGQSQNSKFRSESRSRGDLSLATQFKQLLFGSCRTSSIC